MKFGSIDIEHAEGALLAHTTMAGGKRYRKARRLTREDVAALRDAGVVEVVAAVLSPDDLDEDQAATRLAESMIFRGIEAKPAATGRANLHAIEAGVFTVDAALVDAINTVDQAITVATVAQHATVEKGQMVATVKIIPFAVAESIVDDVVAIASRREIFSISPFRPMRAGVIQTELPSVKQSVLDKTLRITEARLARSGSTIARELRTPHAAPAIAAAIGSLSAESDIVLVFGASALCDFDDVIPAAIRQAGGTVLRTGMPVDPGNLLVLGRLGEKPVLGAPGCARSPKENGFDWVLDRLIAGIEIGADEIAAMGVGGLLMEIPTRPQPREAPAPAGLDVDIVVLAAGQSRRMGGPNKLMALFSGTPLIRRTAQTALSSKAAGTIVVTGHQAGRIREALQGLDAASVHNPDYAGGLSSSLKAGIAAVREGSAGALIMLGDMPAVSAEDLDRMIGVFRKSGGQCIVRATCRGKRGNPVLLPRAIFPAVAALEGDTGARHLVEAQQSPVIDVEIGDAAAVDVDTRDALEGAGGVLQD
jgi:molybdenum cofactor cytidylyltransferase